MMEKKQKIQKKEHGIWKDKKIYRLTTQAIFLAITIYFLLNFTPQKPIMLSIVALILVSTVFLRAAFCGWVCPIGTINDLLRLLGKSLGKIAFIKPLNKAYHKWLKNNQPLLSKVDKFARYFRYLLLLWILQAAIFSFASIKEPGKHGAFSIIYFVIGLLILGLFNSRAWCKYGCPVGGLIGLVSKLSPTHVTRNIENCLNCKKCSKACPMGIDVAAIEHVNTLDCNTCLICIDACPVEDTLALKMNFPVKNPSHGKQAMAKQ